MVEQLLKHVTYIDFRDHNGLTALHYAVRRRHLEIVRALLERGAGMYNVIYYVFMN